MRENDFSSFSEERLKWFFFGLTDKLPVRGPQSLSVGNYFRWEDDQRCIWCLMSKAVWGSSQAHLSAFWWGKSSACLLKIMQSCQKLLHIWCFAPETSFRHTWKLKNDNIQWCTSSKYSKIHIKIKRVNKRKTAFVPKTVSQVVGDVDCFTWNVL